MRKNVHLSELTPVQVDMLNKAKRIASRAYNVYSGYFVGACALSKRGNFYCGTFLENVSFGMTVCAEVSALLSALNNGDIEIVSIAITGGNKFDKNGEAVSPCGRCRQVINEFSLINSYNIEIICSDLNLSDIKITSISELLPISFDSNGAFMEDKLEEFKKRVIK